MKRIKLLLIFLLFFISIKNVYASEDIYLEYNNNSIKLDIEDNNILNDNSIESFEYVYHDNKDNTGLWYINNKDKEKNYINIKEYSDDKITGDIIINSNIFKDITIDLKNNNGKFYLTNNEKKYINGKITFNESKYLSIILKTNKTIYGIVGDYVNNKNLKYIDCFSKEFEVSKEKNRILFESVKGIEKGTVGICNFEKLNEDIGYFYLNNISTSNKNNELYHDNIQVKVTEPKINDIIYNKVNKYINNSKTKSPIIIPITISLIITITLVILLIIFLKKHKKRKRRKRRLQMAILLLFLLIPLNTFAITQSQFNDKDVNNIRNNILNKGRISDSEKNKLDIDKDNKITINDLILVKINYNTPSINIQDGTIEKKDNYEFYYNVNKIVEIKSISDLKELKYCLTASNYCDPTINYNYSSNNISMNIKFEDNKEPQKLCVKVKNNYDLENISCDTKTYLVDNKAPEAKIKSSKVYIGENDKVDLNNNIEPQYGISGGTYKCEGQTNYGNNTIKCIITGNNGLTKEVSYEIIKSITYNKKAIFFGDSITYGYANNGYGWGNFIRDNYDLASTINAGKSGWFISNNQNKDWIVDEVKTHSNNNYDYIILHGGCNDINKDVPLGTFNIDDFSGNYDTNTFLGGLEYYLYTVTTTWKNARIGYIINYKTPNNQGRNNEKSAPYYNEMKKVLNKWNINYLDLFDGTASNGQSYSDLLRVNTNEYLPDTLHLNNNGYNIISPHIYDWMKELKPYS